MLGVCMSADFLRLLMSSQLQYTSIKLWLLSVETQLVQVTLF
uniref:Uncharacterized protein n=1 Tax=Arundo donax TaxID=35708 RepID=A0A0A9FRM4_ARUDO